MQAAPGCPSTLDLQRLLRGQLADSEADLVHRHVEQCVTCQRTLAGVRAPGGSADPARATDTGPETTPPPAPVGPLDDMTPLSAFATVADQRQGGGAESLDVRALLGPPQGPGEMGRLGPYRVFGVLGAGGMGVVFRAEDPQLQRPVALKVISPRLADSAVARERFLREARTAAAVVHDHIMPVYQVGEDRGVPFLALPLLPGETLEDRLRRRGSLPAAEVVRIGRETAEGLAAAHARGLIHRDIKPANIWLEGEPGASATGGSEPGASATGGRVKILDFSLARAVADAQEIPEVVDRPAPDAGLTHVGAVVGTPAYMAPEQARGDRVDHRADVYALGVLLYRLATGRVPFPGADAAAVLAAVQRDRPVPPRALDRRIPVRLSNLIVRLLAKDPAERPASARAVADGLAALAKGGRHRGWILAASGVLAALVAAAVLLVLPRPDDRRDHPAGADEATAPGVAFVRAAGCKAGLNPFYPVVGDLNGDGKADLAVVNMGRRGARAEDLSQGSVSVLLGNGDGTFRDAVTYPVGMSPWGAVIVDLNGDGKPDLVVSNGISHDVSVLLGNGDGTFRQAVHYPVGGHPSRLVAGDFNGDGHVDVALAIDTGHVSILLGKGDGTFRPAAFHASGTRHAALMAGDFNGDGRLDLAVLDRDGGTVRLFPGNGDGTFRAPLDHPLDSVPLNFVGPADFEGAGRLGLAVTIRRAPGLQLLLGNGDGTFRDGPPLEGGLKPLSGAHLAIADFNGDGQPDLVALAPAAGHGRDGDLHLYLGRGQGAFRSLPPTKLGFRPWGVAAGDFNGDGRPDLAVTVDADPTSGLWILLNRPPSKSAGKNRRPGTR